MPPGNCPSPGTALTGVKQKHASVLVLVGSRTEGRSNAQPRVLRTRSTLLPTPYLGAASDPQVKVSGQRECLPVPLIPVATSGCPLCFWPTGCKSEAVNDTFLGSIILLEQLTELRGTCYFLDYWFTTKVMKGSESTAGWTDGQGEVLNTGASELGIWQSGSSRKPHPFGFLWRFHHICRMEEIIDGDGFKFQHLSLPWRLVAGLGTKSSNFLITGFLPWTTSSHARVLSKSPHQHKLRCVERHWLPLSRHLYCFYRLGSAEGFRSSVPAMGMKQIYCC